jgi:hypothetical protein
MCAGVLGCIDTVAQGNRRPPGVTWALDNGAYSDRFDEANWWRYAQANAGDPGCLFAVAPDVVGDALATLARSGLWITPLRELGYRVAYVAQNGIEETGVPWHALDVLFVGGTTGFKLGAYVRDELIPEARDRGVWVHVGRVNSERRWRYFTALGVDSCDGTILTRGPDVNLRRVEAWLRGDHQLTLWGADAE